MMSANTQGVRCAYQGEEKFLKDDESSKLPLCFCSLPHSASS